MQASATSHPDDQRTTLEGVSPRLAPALYAVGVVGLAAGFGLGFAQGDDLRYFYHAYLTNFCYFLSISLGGLFFVALAHATRAGWSVTTRRLAELIAGNVAWLAILFVPILLPVLFGNGSLYVWNDTEAAGDELLELLRHKTAFYLNPASFAVRAVFYLLVWWWMARFFLRRSTEQDASADPALTQRMERFSPVALVLFGFTVSFASFDWLMSLEPAWFSTIYGVYFFSGATVGFLAAVILLAMSLQATGRLTSSITVEHYHDLGKLLFAFVFFWGYIAFSQYMLIWYANVPEETTWYLTRQTGSWKWVSLLLLVAHLLIPFCGLLSREAKRRRPILAFWAVWILIVHWIDVYWLVAPSVDAERIRLGLDPLGVRIGLIDAACLIGIGGIYLGGLLRLAGDRSLVPLGDPRIEESLAFENA